ncbi:MAG: cytochrome c [Bradyrhizobium sp.]|nr:cytochrome c [Bradyrhizobium sp.]
MALLTPRRTSLFVFLAALLIFVAGVLWNILHAPRLSAQPITSVAAAELLTRPIADGVPNADQLRRGQYLVRVGDCMSCHLSATGKPLAGGLGLNTPFGVIYSSNITSDKATGLGRWTPDQFYRAMHDGIGSDGRHLYPAFPYAWFTRVSRADDDAVLAYLKTTPAVAYTPPANRLPFPLNIRLAVAGWNMLFFDKTPFKPDPGRSAEWNRGYDLVNNLGHCAACHTATNMLGAEKKSEAFRGGSLEASFAPDLTSNPRTGLGSWSVDDLTDYLATGRNARAGASSQMADVITYSTSLMSPQDLHAIAVYLKTLPASPSSAIAAADPAAMKRGGAIYSDACTACHLENGVGQARLFPPLGGSAMAQQNDATGLIHLILAGGRVGPSPKAPTPLTMPSFAWKLDDQAVADVATFVRNSHGNKASPVTAAEVKTLRRKLDLDRLHLTVNSGDHPQFERK